MSNVNYKAIRTAMAEKPYDMSLVSGEEIQVVMKAVNQGIDSHLEACFVPDRGDSYIHGARKLKSGRIIAIELNCIVSIESMPVLLRRLSEMDSHDDKNEAAEELVDAIMTTLGFGEGRPWGIEADSDKEEDRSTPNTSGSKRSLKIKDNEYSDKKEAV